MTIGEILRKPIVSLSDGEKVGVAEDVLISADSLKAFGLIVGGPQMKGILSFADVRSVGKDAVVVESSTLIQWATDRATDGYRTFSELKNLNVIDSEGTDLGSISDVVVDESWALTGLEFKLGGVFGVGAKHETLPASAIRKIGPKVITVEKILKE